ncbi:MAG: RNase adapter RapZ [Candidatus Methylopumilus sp.]|nr:RNase adapter RapZ [Candidatus Methylopumilus sp.]
MQLIIVTGMSGSGKSVVLRLLEDIGFYCVDNLPTTLIPQLIDKLNPSQTRIAISIDTRSEGLETLPNHLDDMRQRSIAVQMIFLESNQETLVKRFSETRRRHPLSKGNMTLAESIQNERNLLAPLASLGHHIDTSDLSPNTLRQWVRDLVTHDHHGMTLLFTSFGFKHGVPLDADFVFDVRCLPNPHWDAKLRPLSGKDLAVQEFLSKETLVEQMYQDIQQFVNRWLPHFVKENRHYLTVAVGCTGGQHRSVYLVEKLAAQFQSDQQQVLIRHRELEIKL